MKKIHHLFIIGNGFDLEHGYLTSYKNFREYLFVHFPNLGEYGDVVPSPTMMPDGAEQYDIEEIVGFISRILDKCAGEDWCDLESSLGCSAIRSLSEDLNEVDPEGSDKGMWHAIYNNEDMSSDMNRTFRYITDFFYQWIMNFNDECNKQVRGRMTDVYKCNIAEVLHKGDAFLNFNYTETLEMVYGIEAEKICHIHGKVGDKREDIFVGHGEETDIEEPLQMMGAASNFRELKQVLKKDTLAAYRKHMDFWNRLGLELESIHSFGFSFSDVDMFYIKKIANRVNAKNVIWYINKHDDELRNMDCRKGKEMLEKIKKIEKFGFKIQVEDKW